MDEERLASLKEMEERLGHRFNETVWLDQALTHKSYIHQNNTVKGVSNEVLEFLGDAVLNLAVGHLRKTEDARLVGQLAVVLQFVDALGP